MSDFYQYFKENMDGLNLPAPVSLFGSLQLAVANASIFLSHIDKFGKTLTVGELVGAGTQLERLAVAANLSAAFYVGAVIGSIAVASGRSLAGGTSLADVLFEASKYKLNPTWLSSTLRTYPGIYKPRVGQRKTYYHHASVK